MHSPKKIQEAESVGYTVVGLTPCKKYPNMYDACLMLSRRYYKLGMKQVIVLKISRYLAVTKYSYFLKQ